MYLPDPFVTTLLLGGKQLAGGVRSGCSPCSGVNFKESFQELLDSGVGTVLVDTLLKDPVLQDRLEIVECTLIFKCRLNGT